MIKINISYEDETELKPVLKMLSPIIKDSKVKKSTRDNPYKHCYITTKKTINRRE
ncbi:hypothetical protein [Acetobacterium wieringae]|uniref:hypothetical protein n=1 Tax=Acetobacterium wieringae TaxID=52694 RepID=UPI001E3F88AB|nr:hypothetical protein [Acetobacterium wieringae]